MFKFVPVLAVARFFEALRHNPEGRGYDSHDCVIGIFHYGLGG